MHGARMEWCLWLPRKNSAPIYQETCWFTRNGIYLHRLQQLHALSFSGERGKSDLVLLFKCMHGIDGMSLGELGISTSRYNERRGQFRLQVDPPRTKAISSLFKYREVNKWNNLPLNARSLSSLIPYGQAFLKNSFNLQF